LATAWAPPSWWRAARVSVDAGASASNATRTGRENAMLETIAVLLVLMWLLGMVTSYTMSGFIHLLLLIALVMIVVRLLSGRRVVS
jgi:hypothetical protein